MSRSVTSGRRLAEIVAIYGPDAGRGTHGKISISLPSDLIDQVRAEASAAGLGVSAVVAAAIRGAMASQDRPAGDTTAVEIQRPLRPFAEIRRRSYAPADWSLSSTKLLRDERGSR